MAVSASFQELVAEQLAAVGPIDIRRMFSGAGIFADGLMFALIVADTLYFKTDAAGAKAFEDEGSQPFSYATTRGTHTLGSYWRVPERLFDEPDEMADWARRAIRIAVSGARTPAKSRTAKAAKRKVPKPKAPPRRSP